MPTPNDVNPEEVMHPTGVFFRNPTNVYERDMAKDQNSIVNAISGSNRALTKQILEYTEESKPWMLPGFFKIRELSEVELSGLFRSLMRFRPNIFKVHIKFGEYENLVPINNRKTAILNSFEPRFHTEVAESLSNIFADKSLRVVELIYTINKAEEGNFNSTVQVYGVQTEEEYNDDSKFTPGVLVEYFSN